MKREDLLTPGTYAALPKATMANVDLTCGEKLILMSLIDRLGEHETAWPGPRRLASDVGLTRRAIQKSLIRLVKAGYLLKHRNPTNEARNKRGLPAYEVTAKVLGIASGQTVGEQSSPSEQDGGRTKFTTGANKVHQRCELCSTLLNYWIQLLNFNNQIQERREGLSPPAVLTPRSRVLPPPAPSPLRWLLLGARRK